MALLVLAPAAARTRVIAPSVGEWTCKLGLLHAQDIHDPACRAALAQQTGHRPHVRIHVPEVGLQPGAEIVQSRLAIRRDKETMFGTLSVAFKQVSAFAAIPRKRGALVLSKPALLLRIHQLSERCFQDISEQVPRLDEVIAGVQVAIVLQRDTFAALRSEHAERRSP